MTPVQTIPDDGPPLPSLEAARLEAMTVARSIIEDRARDVLSVKGYLFDTFISARSDHYRVHYHCGRAPRRQAEGATPIVFLKARLNAASES